MKKEMFEHEITILKDTFNQLLSRKTRKNLKKIINRTNPADLAIIFRYFTENEQIQVFVINDWGTKSIEFLTELDETLVKELLTLKDLNRIANLIKNATAFNAFNSLKLRKLDIDPAIATGPFVTTNVDILGVLLYFIIAGKFLNMW